MTKARDYSEEIKRHKILKELADAFSYEASLRDYSDFILHSLEKYFGYKKTVLRLVSTSLDKLFVTSTRGFSGEFEAWNTYEWRSGISGKVRVDGKPIIVNNLAKDKRTSALFGRIFEREDVRALLSVPLATKEEVIGVIDIYSKNKRVFNWGDSSRVLRVTTFAARLLKFLRERDDILGKLNRLEYHNRVLEQLKSFCDLIIENIPIGVVATDEKGYVVLMNRELERMSLQQRDECLGKRWFEVFGFKGETRNKLETSFRTSATQFFPEIHLPTKGASVQPVEMKTDVIRDYSGNIIGVVAICSDITEKNRIEREIEKVERLAAIGRLSAAIAHEIRNPLAGISGALQAIGKKVSGDEGDEKILNRIFKEIGRLDNVVVRLQDLTSPRKMSFERYSILDIVEDSIFFARKAFQLKGIKLVKRLDKNLKPIMMDKSAIKQVILNIMINAMNFMPNGGKLTVETSLIKSIDILEPGVIWHKTDLHPLLQGNEQRNKLAYVAVIVSDNGIGIPQTVIPKIFDAFFSTFDGGTGLGLYISARIMALHNGMIGCRSEEKKGSVFYVLLPVRDE